MKNPPKNHKFQKIVLIIVTLAVFSLGIFVRLYDLTDQPIDFHPTRQLRGAIIARGMYYDILPDADPETRDLAISHWFSTGQYEPSILEFIVSLTYLLIGGEQIWVARAYNTLFWIIGGLFLFDLARRMVFGKDSEKSSLKSPTVAWVAALIATSYYLLNPFSVQASRSFQPDPSMVMWTIISIYGLFRWTEKKSWIWAIAAGIFGGMAILTKAVAAYTIAGAAVGLVIYTSIKAKTDQEKNIAKRIMGSIKRIAFNPQVWVMAILMILPVAIYYLSRSDRASQYFSSWTIALSKLLINPETYVRWLRLVESLMGLAVLLIALLGVIIARPKSRALLIGLWIGYIIYGMFLPYQMYTHNYYHLPLVPIITLSLVPVIEIIVINLTKQNKIWQGLAVAVTCMILLYTAWLAILPQHSDDYRNEPKYWQEIGELLPSDGKIIGLTQDYGYRLMYYGWRKVTLWPPTGESNLAKLRGKEKEFDEFFNKKIDGKKYFLITAFNQYDKQPTLKETLEARFPIYAQGSGYLIFDLTNPLNKSNP